MKKSPLHFGGVVIGSFFSITGVALTNRASDKRLRAQFEHERTQKTKDREMALRKEIYLAAADAIATGTNSLARFSNLDLQNDQITHDYIEKSPSISKVHVIAKANTVQEVVSFSGELSTVFLKLFARRYELIIEKSQIDILNNQIEMFGKERDRFLEMLKQYNIEGINDPRRWETIQNSFEFEQKRTLEAITKRKELAKPLFGKQLEFMRECVSESARLGGLLVPLLAAVRGELELPFDADSYRSAITKGVSKQEEAIEEFAKKFTNLVTLEE